MILLIISMLIANAKADIAFDTAKASIMNIQPSLDEKEAIIITKSLLNSADHYNLDWMIMASIIAQESSFRKDPQNCLHTKKVCIDLGISQINYGTWGKTLNLDRIKLLTDIQYNIDTMAKILSRLKAKYSRELSWHTRYHSFTPSHRKVYADFIYHYFLKISSYAKGYQDKTDNEEKKNVSKRSSISTCKLFGYRCSSSK
jgi:soluble lytic murein transglycosylase-like protein